MVDNFIGKSFGEDNHLTVVGWFGEKVGSNKKYTVHCKVCAEDPELNGDANYLMTRDSIVRGSIPCGCSKRPSWNQKQYEILVKRKLTNGFYFTEWFGDYLGNKSKVVISCPEHGVLAPKTVSDILSGRRCIECRRDNVKKALTKSDDMWIEEFLLTGVFPLGTLFTKTDKKVKRKGYRDGIGGFWNVLCSVCNETSLGRSADLRNGKMGCACSRHNQKFAYIHIVSDNGVEVGLKFGISNSKLRRLSRQRLKSKFSIDCFDVWEFPSTMSCKIAERDVKLSIPAGIFEKSEMADGFTETCLTTYLEEIMRIYEINGGRRVAW